MTTLTKSPTLQSEVQTAAPSKRKIETSKWLLYFSNGFAVVVTAVVFIGWFMGQDLSGTEVIIGGVFGWVATAHGFYYWKAKAENLIKLKREYPDEFTQELQQQLEEATWDSGGGVL